MKPLTLVEKIFNVLKNFVYIIVSGVISSVVFITDIFFGFLKKSYCVSGWSIFFLLLGLVLLPFFIGLIISKIKSKHKFLAGDIVQFGEGTIKFTVHSYSFLNSDICYIQKETDMKLHKVHQYCLSTYPTDINITF